MNFDSSEIYAMKAQLEEIGYANDEQFLGMTTFKHRVDDIIQDLSDAGLTRPLEHEAKFYPEVGNVYWIYDPDLSTREQAFELTSKWVKDTSEKVQENE